MRKKTVTIFLFYFLILSILQIESCAQEWRWYTSTDGLVGDHISFIEEDQKGYLWFLTEFNGASRFDGGRFDDMNTSRGLTSNNIYYAFADKKGNIWFATDRGVTMYDGYTCRQFNTTHGLADNSVRFILEDSRGHFWFGTENGLSQYDGEQFISYIMTHGLSDNNITYIYEDLGGIIWFGTTNGVTNYDGEKFQRLPSAYLTDPVEVIYEDRDSVLWFGTDKGVYNKSPQNLRIKEPLETANVNSITEDRFGNLWLATSNKGIIKVDYHEKKNFKKQYKLMDRNVHAILQDSRGNMWFGTNKGIYKYDGRMFHHYSNIEGTDLNYVEDILEDKDLNLWFATESGILKYTIKNLQQFTQSNGLASNRISCKNIIEDSDGNLWLGTEKGVSKYDGNDFQTLSVKDGLLDNHVLSICSDKKGGIWIGTTSGICTCSKSRIRKFSTPNVAIDAILEDGKANIWFATENGISRYDGMRFQSIPIDGLISEFLIDNEDRLWIGTLDKGLYIYQEGDALHHMTVEDGLASHNIRWILQDSFGKIWFGLQGLLSELGSDIAERSGICCYDGNHFKSYSMDDGLISDDVMIAEEDGNGNLWFGTDAGVMKYNISSNDTSFHFSSYTEADGLISNYVTAIHADRSGNIWFGTNKGVSKYDGVHFQNIFLEEYLTFGLGDINNIYEDSNDDLWFITENDGVIRYSPPKKAIHPRIHLYQIEADRVYRDMDGMRIPTTVKRISFEFKGISFISTPEQIRYSYQLVGHDPEKYQTAETRLSYENLKPGDYRFTVAAIDKDLHESRPAAIVSFHIFRPFHRSFFFVLIVGFVGICLVAGSGYLTVQLNRQRKKAAKFKEILRMQAEAERIQAAKMESLRQLVAGVAHEMNNPIGVISSSNDASNRALKKISEIMTKSFPSKVKEDTNLKKTMEVLKNTYQTNKAASEKVAKIVSNLRKFVRLDEGEWQKTDIHEALDSVVALLEPEMENRITVKRAYGDLPPIYCCPSNLNQVFMTILKNASEAIRGKGEITIRTSVEGKAVKIEISDTGIGIPPENINRIFDPGFTTKGVKVGVGLGLAICHKIIIDEHKGRIDVSSESGKGSTFTITLRQKVMNNHVE